MHKLDLLPSLKDAIPRSAPFLPASLSSFGRFNLSYHTYSTRSRSDIRKLSLTYVRVLLVSYLLPQIYLYNLPFH